MNKNKEMVKQLITDFVFFGKEYERTVTFDFNGPSAWKPLKPNPPLHVYTQGTFIQKTVWF